MKKRTKIALIICCGIFLLSYTAIGIALEIIKPKTNSKNESTVPEDNENEFWVQNIIDNSVLIKKTNIFSSKDGEKIIKADYYTSRLFGTIDDEICIEEWFLYQKNYLVDNNEIFFLSKTIYEYEWVMDAIGKDVNEIKWKDFNVFSYEINNNFNPDLITTDSNVIYPYQWQFIDVIANVNSTIYDKYDKSNKNKNTSNSLNTDHIDTNNEKFFIEYDIDKDNIFRCKLIYFDYEVPTSPDDITYHINDFYLLENTFYSIDFEPISFKSNSNHNFLFGSLLYNSSPFPFVYICSEYNMFVFFIHEIAHYFPI